MGKSYKKVIKYNKRKTKIMAKSKRRKKRSLKGGTIGNDLIADAQSLQDKIRELVNLNAAQEQKLLNCVRRLSNSVGFTNEAATSATRQYAARLVSQEKIEQLKMQLAQTAQMLKMRDEEATKLRKMLEEREAQLAEAFAKIARHDQEHQAAAAAAATAVAEHLQTRLHPTQRTAILAALPHNLG